MSPRTLVISTTYKTRVATLKPCKERLRILIGQLKDSRRIGIGFGSGAQFDPDPKALAQARRKAKRAGVCSYRIFGTVPSQSSNHDVAELHISSMALQANVACR